MNAMTPDKRIETARCASDSSRRLTVAREELQSLVWPGASSQYPIASSAASLLLHMLAATPRSGLRE
jgi:hypothetical protein